MIRSQTNTRWIAAVRSYAATIWRDLHHDRRGVVAMWIALTLPTLMMALGLGIEVSSWTISQVELQRAADNAALAGALNYKQSSSSQTAAGAAANVAEANGVTGTSTRTWTAASSTLTDNMITVAIVSGITHASDTAVKVTVQQSVPLVFAKVFSAVGSVTVTATAYAELVITNPASPQPCIAALQTAAGGGSGINLSGALNIQDTSCSILSNSTIVANNVSGTINTDGVYAGTSISIPNYVTVTGTEYQNNGTIPNPFQNYTALQTALGELNPGVGATCCNSGTTTLNPGTYSSWNIGNVSNVTLNPGLYIVNGDIGIGGTTTVTGTGVTIVSSGIVTVDSGTVNMDVTASSTNAGGAVPGILWADNTTSTVNFGSSYTFPFSGVLYFPNALIDMSGSANLGSTSCAEIVGGSITVAGAVKLASTGCNAMGAPTYGSLPATSNVVLVE
jgi:Flp pilus assembly protein TadG